MPTRFSQQTHASGSAKIFQFPPRGRFARAEGRDESAYDVNAVLPRGAKFASGGAWYHDDAIEADQRRKH